MNEQTEETDHFGELYEDILTYEKPNEVTNAVNKIALTFTKPHKATVSN